MKSTEYVTLQIGNKLRQIRKEKNFNLSELSARSSVSIPMLSKIENGRLIPTLPTLLQMLRALQVDLNEFFQDINSDSDFPGYFMIKGDSLERIEKEENTVGFEYSFIFSEVLERSSMEISHLRLMPGAQREKLTTAGMEYVYLLRGEIEFDLDGNTFSMAEGDSIFFDGNIPHVPTNSGLGPAELLVFYFITMN